jgi:hypothetical protein
VATWPAFELADVFRHHGETYKRANAADISGASNGA